MNGAVQWYKKQYSTLLDLDEAIEEGTNVKIKMASKEEAMAEAEHHQHHQEEEDEEGPPPGWQSFPPEPPLPPPSTPPPPPSEMAQMVCGSCRRLLSYPKGVKHVKCSCCQMVNFVMEAHEVGLVNCGSCAVLLMYPYGAVSVRCSSCRSVTEIGENNKRPPWSEIQGYSPMPHKPIG